MNKKKALPLWLRDGLEKLEKDKKKDVKKVIPSAKNISGYQHGSPTSSPDRHEEVFFILFFLTFYQTKQCLTKFSFDMIFVTHNYFCQFFPKKDFSLKTFFYFFVRLKILTFFKITSF